MAGLVRLGFVSQGTLGLYMVCYGRQGMVGHGKVRIGEVR